MVVLVHNRASLVSTATKYVHAWLVDPLCVVCRFEVKLRMCCRGQLLKTFPSLAL